jgi:malonyl-CoA O-methyltransferase
MKLIFIYGMPAVGKLTVARELARLSRLPLFHNHLVVDTVLSLFEFGSPPFVELRERIWLDIFAKAVEAKLPGVIFTFAFDRTVTRQFIGNLQATVKAPDDEVVFVELTCDQLEQEKRLTDASRTSFGKLSSLEMYRELNTAGAFVDPGIPKGGLSIDVTRRNPVDTAILIAQSLGLPHETPVPAVTNPVRSAYDEWSNSYDVDANRTRDLDREVTQQLLSNLQFESVVEFGCGTGKNTPLFCKIGKQVLSLDFSNAMLAKAQQKANELSLTNVAFREADITQEWPSETRSADLVSCNLVLEHIRDIDQVISEAARSLKPAGLLFISELHPYRQYEGTKARFERDGITSEIEAHVHHVSDFVSAAEKSGLTLVELNEWWHEEDVNKSPRLITLMLEKRNK